MRYVKDELSKKGVIFLGEKRVGRPKKPNSKTKRYCLRLTEEEYYTLKEMAEHYETTMMAMIMDSLKYKIAIFKSQKH